MEMRVRDQRQIVEMLAVTCEEIRKIEIPLQLFVGKGDYRPRIEYFHDAVRAYTQQKPQSREQGGRLSVEFLAYDVSAIRYIQAMPLAPLNPGHQHLSPHTDVARKELAPKANPKKGTRLEKMQLGTLYGKYGVLFSALLKPVADQDYRDRIEEMDEQVEQLAAVLHAVEALGVGKGSENAVQSALAHCEDEAVEKMVQALLNKKNYKRAPALDTSLKGIKAKVNQADKAIAGVEAANMQYVTAQLGLFEQGKETLKALAGAGLNLAGRFTEAAGIQQAQKERGR